MSKTYAHKPRTLLSDVELALRLEKQGNRERRVARVRSRAENRRAVEQVIQAAMRGTADE